MENLYMYILIAAILVVAPGVDFVLVTRNTLSYGTKAGHYTTLGIAAGLTVWTVVAVLGLAAIIAQSIVLFTLIKYLGAAYLIYLGIKSFFAKDKISFEEVTNEDVREKANSRYKSCFYQGALSDILNPKTVIVFMTLMPQFINTNQNVYIQLAILGAILILLAVLWFLIVVYVLKYIRLWFKKPKVQIIFNKATGIMLVLLGIKLLFEEA